MSTLQPGPEHKLRSEWGRSDIRAETRSARSCDTEIEPWEFVYRLGDLGGWGSASTTTTWCRRERRQRARRHPRPVPQSPRLNRRGRVDGDDEPVLASRVQGTARSPPAIAMSGVTPSEDDAGNRSRRRARRPDARLLGVAGKAPKAVAASPARRLGPLPRGDSTLVRVRARSGLSHPVRARAEANEPRGDTFLPTTVGHALRSSPTSTQPQTWSDSNPAVATEDGTVRSTTGSPRTIDAGKLFQHRTSTPADRPLRQDIRFGSEGIRTPSHLVKRRGVRLRRAPSLRPRPIASRKPRGVGVDQRLPATYIALRDQGHAVRRRPRDPGRARSLRPPRHGDAHDRPVHAGRR